MYKIYFGEKVMRVIKSQKDSSASNTLGANYIKYDRDKLDAFLAHFKEQGATNSNLYAEDPEKVLEDIKSRYHVIQAGGGCVYTPTGDVLLIFRRGKWDLPKGKLDKGESIETCAVREVEEETGLKLPVIEKKIGCTFHTYEEKGETILKESHWYTMKVDEKQHLQPQLEEDIEQCKWVALKNISPYTDNMQPSVRDVLAEAVKLINP